MKKTEMIIKALQAFDGKSTILYDPTNNETITFQDVIDYVVNLQSENERLNDMEFTQKHCNLYEENEFLHECLCKQKAKEEVYKLQNSQFKDKLESLERTVEILTRREFDEQRKTYLCGKCQERVFNVYKEKETQISELQKQVDDWVRVHDEQLHCMQVLTIENKNLKKQVDELQENNKQLIDDGYLYQRKYELLEYDFDYLKNHKDDGIRRAVKDTAKEIYGEIDDSDILTVDTQDYGEIDVVPIERLKEIIKSKGVEVE